MIMSTKHHFTKKKKISLQAHYLMLILEGHFQQPIRLASSKKSIFLQNFIFKIHSNSNSETFKLCFTPKNVQSLVSSKQLEAPDIEGNKILRMLVSIIPLMLPVSLKKVMRVNNFLNQYFQLQAQFLQHGCQNKYKLNRSLRKGFLSRFSLLD